MKIKEIKNRETGEWILSSEAIDKLNLLIKAHNEKEEEYTTCEECGTKMFYGLCPCESENFKKYVEWIENQDKEEKKKEISCVTVCNNMKCGKIIKPNTTCECRKPISHFFKPNKTETYYRINARLKIEEDANYESEDDKHNISIGNCYRTREEAQLALDKQMALVRLWDWADKNAYFRPNWENYNETKFFPTYDYELERLDSEFDYSRKSQSLLPYFKTEKDCENFIKECSKDIKLIIK